MTTRKDLAQIAVRLLALFLFLMSLSTFFQSLMTVMNKLGDTALNPKELLMVCLAIVPLVLWWGFCYLLWKKSPTIAGRITATLDQPDEGVVVNVQAGDILEVGLMLFGVWLFIEPLTDIVRIVALWVALPDFEKMGGQLPDYLHAGTLGVILKCVIYWGLGLILLFKARGVRRMLFAMRDAGLKKSDA